MTFKHTKFEDSVTMRSLERLAKEKGLIKTDIFEKIASSPKKTKVDLTPTDNLTENLLKLCNGLRNSGMEKYAEELESTFMIYKQASAMCDCDLVDQAHPDGSPSLEGVQGDAVIETILDQQLAMINMVNKKPTGKLINAKNIINAVKISLGENTSTAAEYEIKINEYKKDILVLLESAEKSMQQFYDKANAALIFNLPDDRFNSAIQKAKVDINRNNLNEVYSQIQTSMNTARPGLLRGVDEDTWQNEKIHVYGDQASSKISRAISLLDKLLKLRGELNVAEARGTPLPKLFDESDVTSQPDMAVEMRNTIKTLIDKIQSWQNTVNTYEEQSDIDIGTKYIRDIIKKLRGIEMTIVNAGSNMNTLNSLKPMLNKTELDINDFYENWIK